LEAQHSLWQQQGVRPSDEERFDLASGLHEDTVAKAAGTYGRRLVGPAASTPVRMGFAAMRRPVGLVISWTLDAGT
jgi:hypothetical protein